MWLTQMPNFTSLSLLEILQNNNIVTHPWQEKHFPDIQAQNFINTSTSTQQAEFMKLYIHTLHLFFLHLSELSTAIQDN
jgi:hypothetical protein